MVRWSGRHGTQGEVEAVNLQKHRAVEHYCFITCFEPCKQLLRKDAGLLKTASEVGED